MAFPGVIGPGGQRYELHEGMKQNFLSLYGEWENGTIMCPSLFPRDFISPVSDLPGVAPLEQHVLHTIRGDDAEEKIFEILKRFGEEEKQPMFVLTKLKITELFMKYCMPDQTFQELKKLSEEKKKKKLDVEIDFAIVHLNIGVILVEVKATDKWPKRNAPFNQLSEREKIIKGLLHEDSHIPVYKVVALPNMDGSGNCKDDFFILKKSDVGSCEEFSQWMHSHFNTEECGSQEKQELRNLLYKLVGDDVHPKKVLSELYKKICSQACLRQRYECSKRKEKGKKPTGDKPKLDELAECSTAEEKGKTPTAGKRKLDELAECSIAEEKGKKPTGDKRKLDELAECSIAEEKGKTPTAGKRKLDKWAECSIAEEKGKKPTGDKPKLDELAECSTAKEKGKKPMGLVKTADEPGLAVMAKDIEYLNPEQFCVFEGPNHQLICGVPGSGKTILLQYKALECARKGEKVIICVPSPLNKKYEAFFETKCISSGVIICTFENVFSFLPKTEEKFHLFVDELQILLACSNTTIFLKALTKNQNSTDNCYCWFTCDETQIVSSTRRTTTPYHEALFYPSVRSFYSLWTNCSVDYLKLDGNHRFTKSYLRTVMRSTVQVCEFVKEFALKTDIYSHRLLWQVYHGIPPFSKKDWQGMIGHHIGGLPVEEIETAGSLKTVAKAVATSIFSELQLWTQKEIAVLVTDDGVLKDLSRSALPKLFGIPLCAIGKDKDAIVCDHAGKSHSFEWPVVIAVCGSKSTPDLCFLAFSRAVVKLVVVNVNWPYVVNFYKRRIELLYNKIR